MFKVGDALEELKKLDAESVDMILTDPPYFINEEISIIRRSNKMKYKGKDIDFKKNTGRDRQRENKDEYRQFIYKILEEYYRVLNPDKHLIMFCDKRDINHFQDYGEKLGFKVRQFLVWQKSNPVPRARAVSPMITFEVMMWLTKGKPKKEHYNWQLGMMKDIFVVPIPSKEGAIERHPTQKPMKLLAILIGLFSKPGDKILDSFAGSGTVGIVAEAMKRDYILIEKDLKWKNLFVASKDFRVEYFNNKIKKRVVNYFLERGISYTNINVVNEILGFN